MIKKLRKICTLSACIFASVAAFSGCGAKENVEGTVEISMLQAGYGVEFMENAIRDFNKIYPDVEIKLTPIVNLSSDTIEGELTSKDNGVDLYLSTYLPWQKYINGDGTSDYLEDLTEFFDEKPLGEGENLSIREKMLPDYLKQTELHSKNWVMNWANGPTGLIVNKKALGDRRIPRTSNEMLEIFQQISAEEKAETDKKKKIYPLIWPGEAWDYWRYVLNVWWAQYEGTDAYSRFWQLKDEDGELSPSVYLQDGILQALEELESILAYEYSYPGSAALPHTDAQAQFMLNRAAFTVSGDWIESEMTHFKNQDIRLIKTPVNSALGEKLGISETQLRAAVDAIDNNEEKPSDIDGETFEQIKTARAVQFNIGYQHFMFIPKNSNAKEETKLFIRFLTSQASMEQTYVTSGMTLPYITAGSDRFVLSESNFQKLTEYKKDLYEIEKTMNYISFDYTSPLRWKAGIQQFYGPANQPELIFSQQNENMRKSARQVWLDEYATVNGSWQSYLSTAGLG